MTGAESRLDDRWADALGIGHAVRVGDRRRDLACLIGRPLRRAATGRARNVARADYHRKMELIRPYVVAKHIDVRDLDLYFLLRSDVADRLRENVGPLLLQQGSRLSGGERLFINGPRFLP